MSEALTSNEIPSFLRPSTKDKIITERHSYIYAHLEHKIEHDLDFSTPKDCAVFYSGSARPYAEEWAKANGKHTIETTKGGKWLNDVDLFNWKDSYVQPSLPLDKVIEIWDEASKEYARRASGRVYAFIDGVDPINEQCRLRTFFRVELPILQDKWWMNVKEVHFMNNDGTTKQIYKKTK